MRPLFPHSLQAARPPDSGDASRAALRHSPDGLREGTVLGLTVAASIWAWVAVVDAVQGRPFHTFTALGGIAVFTVTHCLLNVAYAVVIVAAIRGAAREPSLALAVVFGFVIVEIAFAMVTTLLAQLGLGPGAWIGIFGGSVVGTLVTLAFLWRRHGLAAVVRYADTRRHEQ